MRTTLASRMRLLFGVLQGAVVLLLLLFDGFFNRLQGRQRRCDAFLPPLLRMFRGSPIRRLCTTSSSSSIHRTPRSPTSLRRPRFVGLFLCCNSDVDVDTNGWDAVRVTVVVVGIVFFLVVFSLFDDDDDAATAAADNNNDGFSFFFFFFFSPV